MANPLDEAFNWLVLILTTIAGALSQFPDLWPLGGQPIGGEKSVELVRFLIFPVIFLVFIWLWSSLARKTEYQVVLKSLSWILASIILLADVVLLILGIYHPELPGGPGATFLEAAFLLLILLSPLYFSPLFCFFVVRPRMREIYTDSKFLYSLPKQALLYIAAVLTYFTATGLMEEIIKIV